MPHILVPISRNIIERKPWNEGYNDFSACGRGGSIEKYPPRRANMNQTPLKGLLFPPPTRSFAPRGWRKIFLHNLWMTFPCWAAHSPFESTLRAQQLENQLTHLQVFFMPLSMVLFFWNIVGISPSHESSKVSAQMTFPCWAAHFALKSDLHERLVRASPSIRRYFPCRFRWCFSFGT